MHEDLKEIHVSVRTSKDKEGNPSAAAIYLDGKPVAKGIYTPDTPPPGRRWNKFVVSALRAEGHGIAIIREGDKKSRSKEEVKPNG